MNRQKKNSAVVDSTEKKVDALGILCGTRASYCQFLIDVWSIEVLGKDKKISDVKWRDGRMNICRNEEVVRGQTDCPGEKRSNMLNTEAL